MKVDLHIHTTASDGCWDPEQLMHEIKKARIDLFAVTDHDSVKNAAVVENLAADAGIAFIRGVEITSKFDGRVCHVLGYGIDVKNEDLINTCRTNTGRMVELNVNQVKKMIEDGYPLDLNEFMNYKFDKSRGGASVANFLYDKGLFVSFKDALAYLVKAVDWNSPDYTPIEKSVEIIRKASGHPILAHPGSRLLGKEFSDSEIEAMVRTGIEGLECYTPYHNDELTEHFLGFCRKRDLMITVGSDCHGPLLKARVLGKPDVNLEDLNLREIYNPAQTDSPPNSRSSKSSTSFGNP